MIRSNRSYLADERCDAVGEVEVETLSEEPPLPRLHVKDALREREFHRCVVLVGFFAVMKSQWMQIGKGFEV